MKYNKEELEDLIFNQNLSYLEIGRRYGVSDTYIKKISSKLGIKLKQRAVFKEGWKPANYIKNKDIFCVNCGSKCPVTSKKYCSRGCQSEHKSNMKYKDFIENNDKYCRANYSPRLFKDRFLKDQNNRCLICGIKNEWNGIPLVFVLDHVDGDASNNKRDNLRLICHNCDSQLETYKSKNKNSARKERYLRLCKEK